jgi:MSHA pilin protein MshA
MKNQKGFTLIELVVVIVILGILAVTAAPRFLNLQSDARASALQGLKGAMAGAGSIVYGKAAIKGVERSSAADESITDGNNEVTIVYGYPTADIDGIGVAVEGLNNTDGDWAARDTGGATPGSSIVFGFSGDTTSDCTVTYTAPSVVGGSPTISAATADDC